MQHNFILNGDTLKQAERFTLGALSGAMTGIAAGGDVFGLRNITPAGAVPRPLIITAIRLRWVSTTAFASAQAMAFRTNKVFGFTAIHTTGGTAVQAHHGFQAGISGTSVGDRIPLTEISGYIASTGAITGATYTAEDTDEPEQYAVGAGALLPGAYDDWVAPDGLPLLVLSPDTGIVINNDILMGTSGVGKLFVGIDGFRIG